MRRILLLSGAAARESGPSAAIMTEMRRIVCRPLVEALRAGDRENLFRSPTPEADACTIHSLIMAIREEGDGGAPDRATTKDYVLRFVRPALRLKV